MRTALALVFGLAVRAAYLLGILTGEHWGGLNRVRDWERRREFARRVWSDSARRAADTVAAREYAAALARGRKFYDRRPREVRRVQLYDLCAVSFVVRDSLGPYMTLLQARAYSPTPSPRVQVGEAWTYKPSGFLPGDTITFVFPHVQCNRLELPGLSSGPVPPANIELNVVP